ncbi:MAG: ATP-binding protein [Planctomycetes bacterium]|nr:ATP-binding protein [Planctomycetota bacterium]
MFTLSQFGQLLERLNEARRFIHVLTGPRQTGKTTLARQVMDALRTPSIYATADGPSLESAGWLEAQWHRGRVLAAEGPALLVLDEVQKITSWSEIVKRLWDEDTAACTPLRILLLGSSALLPQQGLTESLAGRFEVTRVAHWDFAAMRDAFGWTLDRYLFCGGYPGAAPLVEDEARWRSYVLDALVETSVSRDILLMTRVDKPALLRRLFGLGCAYSSQILSYQKMLGQLQDAGNTTTLAHYLDLLGGAGMLVGLQKYAGEPLRRRASSPKLLVLNTALMSATSGRTLAEARQDPFFWGRLVETAVGQHLVNAGRAAGFDVHYWRERGQEVDFVVTRGTKVIAIEVKSGARASRASGLAAFARTFSPSRSLLVGERGIGIEEFLASPAERWIES